MVGVMSEERFISIEKQVYDIKKLLSQVHDAIIGNPLSRDGGMARRLHDVEKQMENLETQITETKMKQAKQNIYVIIMWTSLGGVATAIFAYILSLLFNR